MVLCIFRGGMGHEDNSSSSLVSGKAFLLDGVNCTGSETILSDCNPKGWRLRYCVKGKAKIICKSNKIILKFETVMQFSSSDPGQGCF